MPIRRSRREHDLYRKIKWLVFFRALFAVVLAGSAAAAMAGPRSGLFVAEESLFYLLAIAAVMLAASLAYAAVLPGVRRLNLFAYFQVTIDSFLATLIIFVTGSFASIFTFLYLVVIIYSAMVIYRRGGMVVATLCALQYGIMIDLEYFGILSPIGVAAGEMISSYNWQHVIFRLVMIIGACYLVAFLSGVLSEQERSAKQDLWAMEDQVKRMERLAAAGEMAAGLTHEIKNPLASLTGSIQMLKDSIPYDPSHDRLMRIVLREADRLSSLVTTFLMFSRPQAGKVQDVALDEAVEDVVSLLQRGSAFGSRVDINVWKDVPYGASLLIRIDPEHLRQIIWNLMNNAAEAIEGPGRIDVMLARDGRGTIRMVITDTGSGIPPDQIDRIFNPFYSTKPSGTGLGLSIVQQMVGLYGGLVDIESSPGEGTVVTVKFESAR